MQNSSEASHFEIFITMPPAVRTLENINAVLCILLFKWIWQPSAKNSWGKDGIWSSGAKTGVTCWIPETWTSTRKQELDWMNKGPTKNMRSQGNTEKRSKDNTELWSLAASRGQNLPSARLHLIWDRTVTSESHFLVAICSRAEFKHACLCLDSGIVRLRLGRCLRYCRRLQCRLAWLRWRNFFFLFLLLLRFLPSASKQPHSSLLLRLFCFTYSKPTFAPTRKPRPLVSHTSFG